LDGYCCNCLGERRSHFCRPIASFCHVTPSCEHALFLHQCFWLRVWFCLRWMPNSSNVSASNLAWSSANPLLDVLCEFQVAFIILYILNMLFKAGPKCTSCLSYVFHRAFAQHILDTGHAYNTIDETMKVLHIEKKGQKLNTLEHFQIYNLTKKSVQLNDTHTLTHNPIFDILIKTYPHV
jgi:hypothetical protein